MFVTLIFRKVTLILTHLYGLSAKFALLEGNEIFNVNSVSAKVSETFD